jgi:hypothetical protein
MTAVGDEDFLQKPRPKPFNLNASALNMLEKLCLDRLPRLGGDEDAERIALTIIEGSGHDPLEDGVAFRRATRALRLLKKINAVQGREPKEGVPLHRERTKKVLWHALLAGWNNTDALAPYKERLAKGVLELRCFGAEEWKELRNTFYEARPQSGFNPKDVASLLALATKDSNTEILRLMGGELSARVEWKTMASFGSQALHDLN